MFFFVHYGTLECCLYVNKKIFHNSWIFIALAIGTMGPELRVSISLPYNQVGIV